MGRTKRGVGVPFWTRGRTSLALGTALLLRFVELGAVAGFLDGGDKLLRINLSLFDLYNGLVGMGNLSADDARNFFECRLHSFGTVDRSGHARDFKVHGLDLITLLGGLRFGCGRSGGKERRRTMSSSQQQSRTEQCC